MIPATLAESQGTPGRRTLGRRRARIVERWQRRRCYEGLSTHDLTVVHLVSHHPDTSACVGLSPEPPKLPRHVFEALQDGEDPAFGVHD
jgi:hypothetical protein